jgi:hypothetical protein
MTFKHSIGITGVRYITADIDGHRVAFVASPDGLTFAPDVSDLALNELHPGHALEAARYARKVWPIAWRPMFEFANGEVQGNGCVYASKTESDGAALDKYRAWFQPTGWFSQKTWDAVNYTWSENGGNKFIKKGSDND